MKNCWITVFVLCVVTKGAVAITLGQVDDFQDGTLQGWYSPDAASNVPNAGPNGAGDRYLRLTSTGSGSASQLYTLSTSARWGGDPRTAGVTGIAMDLLNLGTVELDMRLIANGGNYGRFTSATPFVLPPDGQWHHITFGLTAGDLTGTSDFCTVLQHLSNFVIGHQSGDPLTTGFTVVSSSLGIDNIQAVPEPLSFLLWILGGYFIFGGRQNLQSHG